MVGGEVKVIGEICGGKTGPDRDYGVGDGIERIYVGFDLGVTPATDDALAEVSALHEQIHNMEGQVEITFRPATTQDGGDAA